MRIRWIPVVKKNRSSELKDILINIVKILRTLVSAFICYSEGGRNKRYFQRVCENLVIYSTFVPSTHFVHKVCYAGFR